MVSFVSYFDLTTDELAANDAVVGRFDERSPNVTTATWFLPYFRHALFGGIHTIFRLMDDMSRNHGVEHRIVIFDPEVPERELRAEITASFPSLEDADIVLVRAGNVPYDELPRTDIGVCTLWTTAFALARFNDVGAKFYMVQDYEPSFYPAGSMYGLTEATYRLGFAGIVNTPGLAEIYESYGNPAVAFTPAFDVPDLDVDKPSNREDEPIRIVLYGRPSVDRNAFELVASACVLLKRRYGNAIRIVSAGEEFDPADLGLEGILENRGLLSTLAEVQQLYLDSDIGICFMFSKHPSYQPFEYLAAGVAPVVNVNPATSWFLRDRENCLIVEPYPSSIADGVAALIDDDDLRLTITERGREAVARGDWDREFDRVWRFITGSGT
jgi:glycosyltransferase involved in cell wall biosynthesis